MNGETVMLLSRIRLTLFFSLTLIIFSHSNASALDLSDLYGTASPANPSKTISMDFKEAKLPDVLKIFSQQSGLNFIASTEVADATVDLYLDKVPVEEALERILSANGLAYDLKSGSNVFVVKKLIQPEKKLMTRVYHLKQATVSSSKLNKTLSKFTYENTNNNSSSSNSSDPEKKAADSGMIAAIQAILTAEGKVIEDPRTNSLIITDIPNQFPTIEQTIARLDVRTPQILIEVEMLDVNKKTADLLGPKWGDTPVTFAGAQKDGLAPFDQRKAITDGFTFADPQYRVGTVSFQGLAFALQFLRTNTDTKNLARPRILTLNNETAEIRIKTDEAIGLNSTTSQDGAVTVNQAERAETGIFLKVTPQANTVTGEITMAIEPKVIQARTGESFGGQTFKDPEERGTKSVLRIRDGDTIILGGLLRTNVEEVRTQVPIISRIPFIGSAFRHKDKKEEERELIIFMNNPLRYKNYTFYQASYSVDARGRELSTLAVVKNSGRLLPYISCLVTFTGLVVHFLSMAFRSQLKTKEVL